MSCLTAGTGSLFAFNMLHLLSLRIKPPHITGGTLKTNDHRPPVLLHHCGNPFELTGILFIIILYYYFLLDVALD